MNNKTKRTNKGKSKTTRRKRRNFKGGDATVQAIIWRQRVDDEKTTDTNPNEYDYALLVNDNPKSVQDAFRRSTDSAEYFLDRSFEMKGPIPNGVNPYVKKLEIKFGERSDAEVARLAAEKKKKDEEDAKEEEVKKKEKVKKEKVKKKEKDASGSEDGDEEDEDEESYEEDDDEEELSKLRITKLEKLRITKLKNIITELEIKNEDQRKQVVDTDTYKIIMEIITPSKDYDSDYSEKYWNFTKKKNIITEKKQVNTIIAILKRLLKLLLPEVLPDDDDK